MCPLYMISSVVWVFIAINGFACDEFLSSLLETLQQSTSQEAEAVWSSTRKQGILWFTLCGDVTILILNGKLIEVSFQQMKSKAGAMILRVFSFPLHQRKNRADERRHSVASLQLFVSLLESEMCPVLWLTLAVHSCYGYPAASLVFLLIMFMCGEYCFTQLLWRMQEVAIVILHEQVLFMSGCFVQVRKIKLL